MLDYGTYNEHLAALAREEERSIEDLEKALGRGPMEALRASRPIAELRAVGSFFTGARMADYLWSHSLGTIDENSRIVDPAVGAGDLLLPPARRLVSLQLQSFDGQIAGTDIDKDFLVTARRRIKLVSSGIEPKLRIHDFLDSVPHEVRNATHVVMNPPFFRATIDDDVWESAKVNAAAVFVERALREMTPGALLLCILPEVLRSGSRYQAWRKRIATQCKISRIETGEQFDARTDVHIFFFEAFKKEHGTDEPTDWASGTSNHRARRTLSTIASVQVGAVVPHRHPETGPSAPFATTRELAPWSTIARLPSRRRFSGRLNTGPFVLVRRTSRPGDRYRAQATIYASSEAAAVENHLLVVSPRDGTLKTCEHILAVFRRPETSDFLDERIRLRHLTVAALNEIPWTLDD